jgi:hypothetical protein
VEWLWTGVVLLVLFGPVLFVFIRGRGGGAPSGDDLTAGSTVTDSVRHIASGGRTPGGSGMGGPLPPP